MEIERYLTLDELCLYLGLKNRRGADRFCRKIGARRKLPGVMPMYDRLRVEQYLRQIEARGGEADLG